MLSKKTVNGRTVYLYGDQEISAEEYAALGGNSTEEPVQDEYERVLCFAVRADGRIEEVSE